jgi:hypothetical protein
LLLFSVDTIGQETLGTPLRDQQTMRELLNRAGVTNVVYKHNANSSEMRAAIRDRCSSSPKPKISGNGSGAVYRPVWSELPGQHAARLYTVGLNLSIHVEPPENTLVILYFSGFGASTSGQDYIMPYAEIPPRDQRDIEATGISVAWLKTELELCSAAAVIILDTGFPDVFDST